MKKLFSILVFLALTVNVFAGLWTGYPFTNAPSASTTFLVVPPSGAEAYQITPTNLILWIQTSIFGNTNNVSFIAATNGSGLDTTLTTPNFVGTVTLGGTNLISFLNNIYAPTPTTEPSNTFYAGPINNGLNAIPTWRRLDISDFNSGLNADTNHYLRGDLTWAPISATNGGTVKSVSYTGDGIIDSSTPSGPITSTGTLVSTPLSQSANLILAGPSSGGATTPTFRSLVNGDFQSSLAPNISAANMTGLPTLNSLGGASANSPTFTGTVTFPSQASNTFFAGPKNNGASAAPTWRKLDISDFNSGTGASSSTYLRGDFTWATIANGGTVTSVTFTGDGNVLSSTPSSAITTSGTLSASLNSQSANKFLVGPTSGGATTPTFRSLVNGDFPNTLAPTISAANMTSIPAVTSVTLSGDGVIFLTSPSSPVTTTGTLTPTLASASPNTTLGNFSSLSSTPLYSGNPTMTNTQYVIGTLSTNVTNAVLDFALAAVQTCQMSCPINFVQSTNRSSTYAGQKMIYFYPTGGNNYTLTFNTNWYILGPYRVPSVLITNGSIGILTINCNGNAESNAFGTFTLAIPPPY